MTAIEGLAPAAWHGYRLVKLELYNWGTFDSSSGTVHSVQPEGATTLLIGQNGSGKSTLVDALLTLLVRPVVRNYNVAAGAQKQERDERSYIRGACGRLGRDDDNRAEVQYLRRDGNHYAAILGCFRNEQHEVITLAQILYLDADNSAQKVYCFADEERSIAEHCSGLPNTERLRQQMEKRGFRATTSYTEYHKWFVRATGVRAKAMDMFNQTVAVKDIQSLNRFIREHMLEAKPWGERIDALQNHVTQLSEAHRSLVKVRQQFELLLPIESKGTIYRERATALETVQTILEASDSFFRAKTIELFEPECRCHADELARTSERKGRLELEIRDANDDIRTMRNELDLSGGQRLRDIPHLLRRAKELEDQAKQAKARLLAAMRIAAISGDIPDEAALSHLQERLPKEMVNVARELESLDAERNRSVVEREKVRSQEQDDQRELAALTGRQGNLPFALSETRRQMCDSLAIKEQDLPFAAELVAVRPDALEWQPSIEMVLRGFALSLLVPTRYYGAVSSYVDRTRLADRQGAGQRLVYLKVGDISDQALRNNPPLHTHSLIRKLNFREGHLLLPWVKHELEARNNFLCCNSVEEFQQARGMAMTRQRHIKRNDTRHEKDDRDHGVDPRRFVLGWDNREKQRVLAQSILRLQAEATRLDGDIHGFAAAMEALRARRAALIQISQATTFASVDSARFAQEIRELEEERMVLEAGNEAVQLLKKRLSEIEAKVQELQTSRDESLLRESSLKLAIKQGETAISNAKSILDIRRLASGVNLHFTKVPLPISRGVAFAEQPLTASTLFETETRFLREKRSESQKLANELEPLRQDLCGAMNRYLRDFHEDRTDLEAKVEYLTSFCNLCEQVRRDDLPRHEARFKERLNEKVTQELGLLNGSLNTERAEIASKIELLNESLRQLEFRPGTYMRLEPRPVRDREIAEFQSQSA